MQDFLLDILILKRVSNILIEKKSTVSGFTMLIQNFQLVLIRNFCRTETFQCRNYTVLLRYSCQSEHGFVCVVVVRALHVFLAQMCFDG